MAMSRVKVKLSPTPKGPKYVKQNRSKTGKAKQKTKNISKQSENPTSVTARNIFQELHRQITL